MRVNASASAGFQLAPVGILAALGGDTLPACVFSANRIAANNDPHLALSRPSLPRGEDRGEGLNSDESRLLSE